MTVCRIGKPICSKRRETGIPSRIPTSFQINRAQAKADTTVYLALADISVTCGKTFAMPVEKVATPAAATLEVAEGVEIPAPVYFKLAD